MDDLTRPEGTLETVETTETVVLTHSEKLDLITVTATVNLDTVATDTAASKATLATIASSSPTYTISNDGTQRTLNADAATGAITSPPTQAEVELLRDVILGQADTIATLIRDLTAKGILDV
jgi:hypothetical protein